MSVIEQEEDALDFYRAQRVRVAGNRARAWDVLDFAYLWLNRGVLEWLDEMIELHEERVARAIAGKPLDV